MRILPYGMGAEMMGREYLIPDYTSRHDFNSNNLGAAGGLRPMKKHQRAAAKIKARKRAAKLGHK